MIDWPTVTLVLGLCACGVAVYAVKTARVDVKTRRDVEELNARDAERARNASELSTRLVKLEAAMRIDGVKLQAEAARGSLPALMR